jgi:hypothetical protein
MPGLETLGGGCGRGVQFHNLIHVRHFQHLLDVPVDDGYT